MKRIIILAITGWILGSTGLVAGTLRGYAPDGPVSSFNHAIDISPFTPCEATFGDSAEGVNTRTSDAFLAPVTPREATFEDMDQAHLKEAKGKSGQERNAVIPHPDGFKPCDTHFGCGI
jgi:hypothetical protein